MTETVQGRVPQEEIEEALKEVIDPELGVNIVTSVCSTVCAGMRMEPSFWT